NLPPNFGFQCVSAVHWPSAKRQVRSSAWLPPMVSTPPSQATALWKTLLSGSSTTTGFQPASVCRTIISFAGPGTEVVLPSAPALSPNCAGATSNAGYGPPTRGSRRGAAAALAAEDAGCAAGGALSPPPQATSAPRTRRRGPRGIRASSRLSGWLSTNTGRAQGADRAGAR